MAKEIIIRDNYSLGKIKDVVAMADVLKQHIIKQELFTTIKGKNYSHVDGWQFAGMLTGLNVIIENTENLSNDKEIKWKATAYLYSNDKKIGSGEALCSNKEAIKKSFDEYAILSMAQTRAIGKAYRNKIGWIMKMAGMEATPAEEIKFTSKDEKMTKEVVYKMTIEKIETCDNKTELNQIKDKVAADKKLFTQKQVFDLLEKINAKLGNKK